MGIFLSTAPTFVLFVTFQKATEKDILHAAT